jgi:tetratricopeptide (TPR) repeat protein
VSPHSVNTLQKFLRWIGARLGVSGINSLNNMRQLVLDAQAPLLAEEYEKARAILLEALEFRDRVNDSATIHSLLTSLEATWLFTEKYDEAIAFFSEYILRYPEDCTAYSARGAALWYSGRLQEALHDYHRALELNPRDPVSLSGRGQVLAEIGETEKAMEDLDLALHEVKTAAALSPRWAAWYKALEAFVRNGRGFALATLGENGSAMEEFEHSIALCPDNAWVYHNRAQVHDRAGSREQALVDYRTALEKKGPALSPIKRSHAEARVLELSDHS